MSRDDLLSPTVAWPTLLVFFGAVILWTFSLAIGMADPRLVPLSVLLSTIAAFAAFTPMHDAAHRSLSRFNALNVVVGWVCATLLGSPFAAFTFVHREHHQHTNDPVKDPDYYSGTGPRLLLPLRWATQELHYYGRLLRGWGPKQDRLGLAMGLMVIVATFVALCIAGYAREALLFWVLPARIAVTLLAYTFDYLPHRPHKITAAEDRFRATHILPGAHLTFLFLCQNYHLVHHLYPAVPFYRYPRIWKARREELMAKGAQEMRFFGGLPR